MSLYDQLKDKLDKLEYVAPIPKGILKVVKRNKAQLPEENPNINGNIYPEHAYLPDYWDERIMPSEYNKEMCKVR